MSSVLEEFVLRRGPLARARFDEASARLRGFLEWMESRTEVRRIVDKIRTDMDVQTVLARNEDGPPRAASLEEIACVGVYMMEQCRDDDEFFRIVYSLGIDAPGGSTKLQDYVDEAMETFIHPTLDFIQHEVERSVALDAAVEARVMSVISPEFSTAFPKTCRLLTNAAEYFTSRSEDSTWSDVGNTCRDVLITFAHELREAHGVKTTADTKEADAKEIIGLVVDEVRGGSRFRQTLKALVTATWDHSQCLVHRRHTTRAQAERLFMWTALVVHEVATLSREVDPEI